MKTDAASAWLILHLKCLQKQITLSHVCNTFMERLKSGSSGQQAAFVQLGATSTSMLSEGVFVKCTKLGRSGLTSNNACIYDFAGVFANKLCRGHWR